MTGKEILAEAKEKMAKSGDALKRTLADIRAGRANASLLNTVTVEYYGAPTPLNQLASITIPEARQLLISPYDKTTLKDIERAIYESNLGLTPQNDGETIRLVVPQLTEDRRKELVKDVKAEMVTFVGKRWTTSRRGTRTATSTTTNSTTWKSRSKKKPTPVSRTWNKSPLTRKRNCWKAKQFRLAS